VPELPEVESYRLLAEKRALGRRIASVDAPDAWFLKGGTDREALESALTGRLLQAARRRGKLLLLDLARSRRSGREGVLGLRFGMTGRLLVDGEAGVDQLLYSTRRADPAHARFGLRFADGGRLEIDDPRRLGGVELDPDEERLGPDALAVGPAALRRALVGSVALKARLMDQSRLAGVGNLIADEILWRSGLDPTRLCSGLSRAEVDRLHRTLRSGVADLIRRGGSHTGDLTPHRRPGGLCPRDGSPLVRGVVGGRTTWWCPVHQV
jgi:formamidopyrimidine-DNA glycosylase